PPLLFLRGGRMTWINAASHPRRHTGHHGYPDFTEFTAAAGRRAAPADVLHRVDQPAACDGVVGGLAGVDALAGAGDAAIGGVRRLAACVRHAVPDAAELLLRLPADHVSEMDGTAGRRPLAFRTGRRGPVRGLV